MKILSSAFYFYLICSISLSNSLEWITCGEYSSMRLTRPQIYQIVDNIREFKGPDTGKVVCKDDISLERKIHLNYIVGCQYREHFKPQDDENSLSRRAYSHFFGDQLTWYTEVLANLPQDFFAPRMFARLLFKLFEA